MRPALSSRNLVVALVVAGLVSSIARPALSQDQVCGQATVIDGDTLRIAQQVFRIWGIDALERDQVCADERGKPWACGRAARIELEQLAAAGEICCTKSQGPLSHDRVVATCIVAGAQDIGQAMIRTGHALDCPRFSLGHYRRDEAIAQSSKRGIWAGVFQAPWRHKSRSYCCSAEHPRSFCGNEGQ